MIQFVFDVESIGLHGEGYAVGYVVTENGKEVESGMFACDPICADGELDDRQWVEENISPLDVSCSSPNMVRSLFWECWMRWKSQGAVMFSDCGWPVEARFLNTCIDESKKSRKWNGPYPLHDIATVAFMKGIDPLGTYDREENELPKHNPVCDARQSARLLYKWMTSEDVTYSTGTRSTSQDVDV